MKQKLDVLETVIRECGAYARECQSKIHRSYKPDGTVLTETDIEVTHRILSFLKKEFPQCNVLTEEIDCGKDFNPSAPYTFILDPIDGTDAYSQGQAPWCIGLGILDSNRKPVGGFICAPRFGQGCDELFLRTDPDDDKVYLNNEIFDYSYIKDGNKDVPKQITVGSGVMTQIPFSKLGCHFRSYGCALIHIASAIVFCGIDGCVSPTCYVWDIAAAHSIILKTGMDFQYWDGGQFEYDDEILLGRKKFYKPIVVGTDKFRKEIINRLCSSEA